MRRGARGDGMVRRLARCEAPRTTGARRHRLAASRPPEAPDDLGHALRRARVAAPYPPRRTGTATMRCKARRRASARGTARCRPSSTRSLTVRAHARRGFPSVRPADACPPRARAPPAPRARAGTHAGLAKELAKFIASRDARVALAARRRDDELRNVRAIADCDEKMADDTFREHADALADRLSDAVYVKYGKPNPSTPAPAEDAAPARRERKRAPLYQAPWLAGAQRRRLLPAVQIRYSLSEAEVDEDLEFLLQEAEKAKHARELEQRGAGDADDDEPLQVSYDKQHNLLLCGEHALERWAAILITDRSPEHPSGQQGDWCITAIGPLEVTLRNVEGTRTKVRARARAPRPAPAWPRRRPPASLPSAPSRRQLHGCGLYQIRVDAVRARRPLCATLFAPRPVRRSLWRRCAAAVWPSLLLASSHSGSGVAASLALIIATYWYTMRRDSPTTVDYDCIETRLPVAETLIKGASLERRDQGRSAPALRRLMQLRQRLWAWSLAAAAPS